MIYRRDVDGLRAIAVLSVIAFHAHIPWFQGGYVGVDIFFVISGFLISSLLISEHKNRRFSIVSFYERRARRILPMLFLVVIASLPFAWFWMLPDQFGEFSKSLITVSLFASNYYFSNTSYFAPSVDEKVLQHMWSLSVEEQFYLVYPVVIFLAWKYAKKQLLLVLVTVALVSFGYAQRGTSHMPEAIFYDTRGRLWELLLGSVVAVLLPPSERRVLPGWCHQLGAFLGCVLIGYSVYAFNDATPFPGGYALVPTLGTALVIFFSRKPTVVGKVLSHRMLVGIGLISYSAYLWHQPLFAFAKIRSLTRPDPYLIDLLALASLGLAYLSWRFVEVPFRNKAMVSRRTVFIGAIALTGTFLGLSVAIRQNLGFSSRAPADLALWINTGVDNNPLAEQCRGRVPQTACVYGTTLPPRMIVWGDSHADQLVPMFASVGTLQDFAFAEYTYAGCPPILGVERRDIRTFSCSEAAERALRAIEANDDVQWVIMHSYWQFYLDDGKVKTARRGDTVAELFAATVRRLVSAGKKVVIVSPVPRMPYNVPQYLMKVRWFDAELDYNNISLALSQHRALTSVSQRMIETAQRSSPYVFVFDPAATLCQQSHTCRSTLHGRILYRDDNHLSVTGGFALQSDFVSFLRSREIR